MKVVIDTNVFVSGVFFGGVPGRLLQAWRAGKFRLVLSAEILEEYAEVLRRLESRFPGIQSEPILELILAGSDLIQVDELPAAVCNDPDDDKFVACAIASDSACIVTGDKQLLKLNGYRGLAIVQPAAFLKEQLKPG